MFAGEEEAGYHRDALVERLRSIGLDVNTAKVATPTRWPRSRTR